MMTCAEGNDPLMETGGRRRWLVIVFLVSMFCVCGAHEPTRQPVELPALPPEWRVTEAVVADVTGDGAPEWVLLVWRPWQDWPIQRWSNAPSPIAGYHDAAGDSCHLILIDPRDGREIWAGSALPAPLLTLSVEDVDGDGRNEVRTLEGSYAGGLSTHVDVWRWNGFGFTLQQRSPVDAEPGAQNQMRRFR